MGRYREGLEGGLESPARDVLEISPSNDDDLASDVRAIYVGTSGDISLVTVGGSTATFVAVPAGSWIPVRTRKVLATGTDADDLVGLI